MKKRRYVDLYGYTLDELDRWLERGINKKRSAGKSRPELDMPTVFAAMKIKLATSSPAALRNPRVIA